MSDIQLNIPFADYLRWPVLSYSSIKEGRKSMAHLKCMLDGESKRKVTDDMTLGSALHVAFLEPELMNEKVVLWDDGRRAGGDWEMFCNEHRGKYILTAGMHAKLVGMVRSLRKHKSVREWLGKIEHTEVSTVGEIAGVKVKSRCDALTADPLVDLKKVQSGDMANFIRSAMNFGYDIQSYVYSQVFERDRFMFITVEDSPPFDVVPYECSPAFVRGGSRETLRVLNDFKQSVASGCWPGRSAETVQLEVPEYWAAPDSESLTVDGQAAFLEEVNGG